MRGHSSPDCVESMFDWFWSLLERRWPAFVVGVTMTLVWMAERAHRLRYETKTMTLEETTVCQQRTIQKLAIEADCLREQLEKLEDFRRHVINQFGDDIAAALETGLRLNGNQMMAVANRMTAEGLSRKSWGPNA